MPGFYDNLLQRRQAGALGGLSGAFRGAQQGAGDFNANYLLPEEENATLRAHSLAGQYDTALSDPNKTAGLFSSFYNTAAQGIAAPAMRDFRNTLSNVQANTAARFGGNASSEESRNIYNTSDLFSRNLSESLARLAPEAVGQGLQYTSQLGEAAGQSAGERDRLNSLILQGVGMYGQPKKKGNIGGLLGGIAGSILGPIGGAIGSRIGGSISGKGG